MQVCSRAGWLWALALASACAIGCGRAETGASAASAGGETATQPDASATAAPAGATATDPRREMTWEEYYVDVERRARRKGGFVMWLNPPRTARRTSGPPPAGIVHQGAPFSSPVR